MNKFNNVVVISANELDERQKEVIVKNLSVLLLKPIIEFTVDQSIGKSLMIHVDKPLIYTDEVTKITVISASDLNEQQKDDVKNKIIPLFENPIVNFAVDSELIGGLVFRVNDKLIDTSIQNKLASLQKILPFS